MVASILGRHVCLVIEQSVDAGIRTANRVFRKQRPIDQCDGSSGVDVGQRYDDVAHECFGVRTNENIEVAGRNIVEDDERIVDAGGVVV
jgi:hypothetical protein